MRPLVSVVIPAHNPGRYIEPCVRSILRQSLPRNRFEVVFVDDGSDDGTAERLNRLAREQPHVRVIHIPASGAPGRPRNVGLEAALGEYVQFLDADDELAPRALQRLLRMARANRSDIVLGKFASETMSRRQDLFSRNRGATTLAETPQLADASLGPTKLFRAALLRERGITFPEGWRQMEDQLFTLRAYLAAEVISILGDEPCYFFNRREDERHISAELVDPETHVEHLAEILDEVDAKVDDEALRLRFLARFYRTEMLQRLGGAQFIEAPADYRAQLFEALRALARERIGEAVLETLGEVARIRSRLLLEGDLDGLVTLDERVEALTLDARVTGATWINGLLRLRYRAILRRGLDGDPVRLRERDDRVWLDPRIAHDLVGPVDVTGELAQMRAQVSVVEHETALEWIVPGGASVALEPVGAADPEGRLPALVGAAEVDPMRVGPGERPLDDGTWDVMIRWVGLGLTAAGPLRLGRGAGAGGRPSLPPGLIGRPARWVVPGSYADGALRVGIGGIDRLPARMDGAGRRVLRDGASVSIALPVSTDRVGLIADGLLVLRGERGTFTLPAAIEGSLGEVVVSVTGLSRHDAVPRGRYELTAHLATEDAPGLPAGAALVRGDGRVVVVGMPRVPAWTRLRKWGRWSVTAAEHAARTRVLSAFRRLPQPVRDAIRTRYFRARV